MLADARSTALVDNFASQWLQLNRLRGVTPDVDVFFEFDENLRADMERETTLFLESQLREDHSLMDLLTADYTFLNERLAGHYGTPGIYGERFRRVTLDSDHGDRGGLLGHASVLTVTAYPTRTSPVLRGKWLLDNILGMPPPPPPADVPALTENRGGGEVLSLRERMEQHRRNPACAVCHRIMDPPGFALENFDAIGRWRATDEGGIPVDASGALGDGTVVDGPAALRAALRTYDAINALAPTVFARRRDQGLAVTTIFLFNVVALLALLPVGTALGLDTESAGLWAGLAVNDLSSSVAVGGQFGEDESVLAAMAKTVRIVLLGPLLLVFSQLRRRAPAEDNVRLRLTAQFPLFVVGYLMLFVVRALGDRMFAATGPAGGIWGALLEANDNVVSLAIAAVCASIGLQIHVRTLVDVGWRVAVTAGAAWVTIAGLSLGLLRAGAHGATVVRVTGGLVALGHGFVVFRRWGPTSVSLRARLEDGEPLTLRETVDLLALLDQDGPISAEVGGRVLERGQPAIGELVSLRESPIQGGINYRRLTYWRSPTHGSSLVGILWTPGTTAHIHSHDYSAVGQRIEGSRWSSSRASERIVFVSPGVWRSARRSGPSSQRMTPFTSSATLVPTMQSTCTSAARMVPGLRRGTIPARRTAPSSWARSSPSTLLKIVFPSSCRRRGSEGLCSMRPATA